MSDGFGLTRDRYNPRPPLKARGNLSYMEFIGLIKLWWGKAHPEIPLIPMGKDGEHAITGPETGLVPCIVYSMQLRKTHPNEPKMRLREERNEQSDSFIVGGQRFQNIVYFEARSKAEHVEILDDIIERFEDFMLEMTPALKECGLSEIVYARRLQDSLEQRPGANIFTKTVSYMVTTEKVITTRANRLTEAVVEARTWLDAMSKFYVPGTIYDTGPRYVLSGPDAYIQYYMTEDALENATSFNDLQFAIPKTNFRIGDVLFLMDFKQGQITWDATPAFWGDNPMYWDAPSNVHHGFFQVSNIIGEPYDIGVKYTLTRRSGDNPDIDGLVPGMGAVFFFPQTNVNAIDEFKG